MVGDSAWWWIVNQMILIVDDGWKCVTEDGWCWIMCSRVEDVDIGRTELQNGKNVSTFVWFYWGSSHSRKRATMTHNITSTNEGVSEFIAWSLSSSSPSSALWGFSIQFTAVFAKAKNTRTHTALSDRQKFTMPKNTKWCFEGSDTPGTDSHLIKVQP